MRSVCVGACETALFLEIAVSRSSVSALHTLFFHPAIDGHLDCLWFSPMVDKIDQLEIFRCERAFSDVDSIIQNLYDDKE